MTVRDTDPTGDEHLDLESSHALATAELGHLRPLAAREMIRQAGYDPDTGAGKQLLSAAADNPDLSKSVDQVRRKASELGLSPETSPPVSDPEPVTGQSGLIDPNFPAWHPRNDPDDVAGKVAMRDYYARAAAEERAQKAAERGEVTNSGYTEAEAKARADARAAAVEGRGFEPQFDRHGRTAEQRARLADTSKSTIERVQEAREAGDWGTAAALERQWRREQKAKT
ncbi:MAG: hypothetical protein PVG83_01165 [Acidimicrobiia bacterium]|jgi:hypothetical protein